MGVWVLRGLGQGLTIFKNLYIFDYCQDQDFGRFLLLYEKEENKKFCRIALGNITKNESVEQMEHIKIFLHEKEKFNFFLEQDEVPDGYKLEPLTLQKGHATTFTLR